MDDWPEIIGPVRDAGRADELRLLRKIRQEVLPNLTMLEREGRLIRAEVKDANKPGFALKQQAAGKRRKA